MISFARIRWVFWTDTERGTIERVGVDGNGREVIRSDLGTCIDALTLDYDTFTIFWISRCTFIIESVNMNGKRMSNSVRISTTLRPLGGISIFGDYLYWTESGIPSTVNRVNKVNGTPVVQVSGGNVGLYSGIEVVHPDKQPNGECPNHTRKFEFQP